MTGGEVTDDGWPTTSGYPLRSAGGVVDQPFRVQVRSLISADAMAGTESARGVLVKVIRPVEGR